MRYRDCPTVEVSERITADPAVIWSLVTDIALPVQFSTELQSAEWLDGASEVVVGARFRGTNRHDSLGEWTTECQVVEVEPGRRWVWAVQGTEGVGATWGFELDPGSDAVTVRQWARMGPGPSGLTYAIGAMPDKEARIISRRLAEWGKNMTANLAGIRELADRA